jgi:hypothetical protein
MGFLGEDIAGAGFLVADFLSGVGAGVGAGNCGGTFSLSELPSLSLSSESDDGAAFLVGAALTCEAFGFSSSDASLLSSDEICLV